MATSSSTVRAMSPPATDERRWHDMQSRANMQRREALAAFQRRYEGEIERTYRPRDLADAMEHTNSIVEAEDDKHKAARAALVERLRQPLPRRGHPSRRALSSGSSSTSSRSISSDDSTRVVPPPREWTIPGRTDREHVSSVGDRLLGAAWRNRLKGPQAGRYHVRRADSQFGQPLNDRVVTPPSPAPAPAPPRDPTGAEVVMDTFRLRSVLGDVQPDQPVMAAEFIAQGRWTCGEMNQWRAFVTKHWENLEAGIVGPCESEATSHPDEVGLVKQRLLSRLLVLRSALCTSDTPDELALAVESVVDLVDAVQLWRRKLHGWAIIKEAPRAVSAPRQKQKPKNLDAPITPMRLTVALLYSGIDLTVVFASSPSQLASFRSAIELDLTESLRPRSQEIGSELFGVQVESLEYPGVLSARVAIVKRKVAVDAFSRRAETALLEGSFSTRHCRDALLNLYAVPSYGVSVQALHIEGLQETPSHWRTQSSKPPPHAPKFLDLQRGTAVYAPLDPSTATVAMRAEPRAPPNFLEAVWKDNNGWDAEARALPPFGTEVPRNMHAPVLMGRRPAPGHSQFRLADGSIAPEGYVELLRREPL